MKLIDWILGVGLALGVGGVVYHTIDEWTPKDAGAQVLGKNYVTEIYTDYEQIIPDPNTDTWWAPGIMGSKLLLHADADTLQVTLYYPGNSGPGTATDSTKITVYGPTRGEYYLNTSDTIRVELGAADGVVGVFR